MAQTVKWLPKPDYLSLISYWIDENTDIPCVLI